MDTKSSNATPTLLTREDAARMLIISVTTIDRLVKRRDIAHLRIGARVLFKPEHIEDFLNRSERTPDTKEGRAR